MIFSDGQFLLKFVAKIGGVDHGGAFVDGVGEFFGRVGENQLGAGQPDGAVKRAPAADHDHFMFQSRRVRKLPDGFVIGAGHASGRCGCHGPRCTGSDYAGFGPRELRQAPAHCPLQIEHVDEMLRCLQLCLTNFWKFQRTAKISPGATAINDSLHAEPGVNVLSRIPSDCGGSLCVEVARSNLAQQWSSGHKFYE